MSRWRGGEHERAYHSDEQAKQRNGASASALTVDGTIYLKVIMKRNAEGTHWVEGLSGRGMHSVAGWLQVYVTTYSAKRTASGKARPLRC